MNRLTDRAIRSAKVKISSNGNPIKYELTDSTGERGVGRLVVRVSQSGTKEFAYKYKVKGKVSYIQLGRYPSLSLHEAREAITPHIKFLREGKDPKKELEETKSKLEQQEKKDAEQGSISELFIAYTDQMKQDGKRTHEATLRALKKEVFDIIPPNKKAKDIKREEIVCVLAEMIDRGATTQSNRLRSYLSAAFNYALRHDNNPAVRKKGIRFGIEHNPVEGIPKQASAERVGENHLSLFETKQLLSTFEKAPRVGKSLSNLLKLCFHTGGQRPYELISLEWNAVNWNERTLLVPPLISKNKKEHLIPLTETAFLILEEIYNLNPKSDFIFQNTRTKKPMRTDSFSTAVSRYLEANKNFKKFIPRDIRRTCKTLLGELGASKEIRDRLQNHALNDVSSRHYDRYDYLLEKRSCLELLEKALT